MFLYFPYEHTTEFVQPSQPGYRAHMEEALGRKNRDLGNRASPAPHMNTSIFLQRKEWRDEISETEPAQLTGLI